MISATLDSSVYVRAFHFGGPAALLIAHARAGNIRIDISDPILNETLRVLRDKFQWNGYMIQDARGKLLSLGNRLSPTVTLSVIKEDPDDDRILECATAALSDFVVTVGYIEFEANDIQARTAGLLKELIGFGLVQVTPT